MTTAITQLRELLEQASALCVSNIANAHNIDLEDMSQTLDNMCDELNAIENFEVYENEK